MALRAAAIVLQKNYRRHLATRNWRIVSVTTHTMLTCLCLCKNNSSSTMWKHIVTHIMRAIALIRQGPIREGGEVV